VENAYADSYPHIASLCAITPQHRLWFGSAFASCCGWADGKKAVVPRGGIEPPTLRFSGSFSINRISTLGNETCLIG